MVRQTSSKMEDSIGLITALSVLDRNAALHCQGTLSCRRHSTTDLFVGGLDKIDGRDGEN